MIASDGAYLVSVAISALLALGLAQLFALWLYGPLA
jgi:hypothetical protein